MADNKQPVRRLVEESVNRRSTAILDEDAEGEFAEVARRPGSRRRPRVPSLDSILTRLDLFT